MIPIAISNKYVFLPVNILAIQETVSIFRVFLNSSLAENAKIAQITKEQFQKWILRIHGEKDMLYIY